MDTTKGYGQIMRLNQFPIDIQEDSYNGGVKLVFAAYNCISTLYRITLKVIYWKKKY